MGATLTGARDLIDYLTEEHRMTDERDDSRTWWQRLLQLEPAVVVGFLTATLALAAGLGLQVTDHGQAALVAWVGTALPLLQAVVTRARVYAPATVAATVVAERRDAHADGVEAGMTAAALGDQLAAAGELETGDVPTAAAQGPAGLGAPEAAGDLSGP